MSVFLNQLWRLENLYKIVDEKGNKVEFKLRPMQSVFYNSIHFYNLILKARQLGFTTLIDLLALDMCLFNSNFHAVIIAHTKDDAKKIFREKVKDVYNDLPEDLKNMVKAIKNDAGELILSNGSSVRVTTSSRSGTCQFLHVSEYGKICVKFPEKALEIKTGSLPSVHPGGYVFFESTAEGNAGHFFDLCTQGEKDLMMGLKLAQQEFKFHFFPWWLNKDYVLKDARVIPERLLKYFDQLSIENNIELSAEQMNWYALADKNLGEEIHREYPSFSKEAFRVSQEGTYYKREFEKIYKRNGICKIEYEPSLPVYTFWDLGISDDTAIWFVQFFGREIRVIDYYENNGEGLPHYVNVLFERGYKYGGHYAPHDIAVRELGSGKSRVEIAAGMGLKFEVVATNVDLIGGIENVRQILPMCWFNDEKTELGVKGLENYRKEWDEKHGIYKAKPLHDWCSHSSDAFRTMAVAYHNNQIIFTATSSARKQLPTSTEIIRK